MQCRKCGNENIGSANYCRSCGQPFSEEERKAAYDKTIFGKLDKLEDLKGWLDFSKITGNRIVRAAFLICLLALVVFNVSRNGTHLAIGSSEDYTVAYHQEKEAYTA